MHKFKDCEGREWSLQVNVAAARELRDRLDIDLLDGGQSLQKLADDPYTAANVLYVLCERQAKAREISDEQFGEALAGDSFEDATTALLEEVIDFFPRRQREAMKKILATLATVKGKAVELTERKLDGPELETAMTTILTQAEAEIDARLAELTAGVTSGSGPAQPA